MTLILAMLTQKVNRMIRQLSKFASEVTRVAQEGLLRLAVAVMGLTCILCSVGTKGILGGQAVVDGVQGTWDELTRNVNVRLATLTLTLGLPYSAFAENGGQSYSSSAVYFGGDQSSGRREFGYFH